MPTDRIPDLSRVSPERVSAFLHSVLADTSVIPPPPGLRLYGYHSEGGRILACPEYATNPSLTPRLIEAMARRGFIVQRTCAETQEGVAHVTVVMKDGEAHFSPKTILSDAEATAHAATLALWPTATEEQRSILIPASADTDAA